MESKKTNQINQKYSDDELELIKRSAERQHLKVATFVRKCVLEKIKEEEN